MNYFTVRSRSPSFQGKLRATSLNFLASRWKDACSCWRAGMQFRPKLHLDRGECGNEVFDDIIVMFQPAREPHQSIADAELRAGGGREALVRRGRRMRDQALGVAEIVADLDELERILKTERASLAACHL